MLRLQQQPLAALKVDRGYDTTRSSLPLGVNRPGKLTRGLRGSHCRSHRAQSAEWTAVSCWAGEPEVSTIEFELQNWRRRPDLNRPFDRLMPDNSSQPWKGADVWIADVTTRSSGNARRCARLRDAQCTSWRRAQNGDFIRPVVPFMAP